MEKRSLGKSGLTVSAIGLGCMGMSEFYGEPNLEEAKKTIEFALSLGINLIDTADMYGFGKNEQLVGKALKSHRKNVVLATKGGIVRDPKNPTMRSLNGRPDYIKKACEQSIKRLGTEIDIYFLHRIDPNVPLEETMGALSELVQEGKIKHIGLSEASADEVRRAHRIHPLAAIQSEYSLFTRDVEAEILPLCKMLGIGFIGFSPLGRGLLSGTIRQHDQLIKTDLRKTMPRFQPENLNENLRLIRELETIAQRKHCTPAQLSLAWLHFSHRDVVPIVGTSKREHLKENVASLNMMLTNDDIELLKRRFPLGIAKGNRAGPQNLLVPAGAR